MKTSRLFFFSVMLICVTWFVSCDKDDGDNGDIAGTISLNMMNENNGKTELGDSDVYIDHANNFNSNSCLMVCHGAMNGIGNFPDLKIESVSSKIAVEQGHGYQIFREAAVRLFPSGKFALNIGADYYNVYVASYIKQNAAASNINNIIGANVKYVLMDVPDYNLPKNYSYIGVLYNFDRRELTIELPVSDFEYEPDFADSSYYTIEHGKEGNKLNIKLVDFKRSSTYGFFIRVNNSFTYVYGHVEQGE